MSMSLAEMRTEMRSLLNEDVEDFYKDSEIDGWLNLGARHVSSVALCSCNQMVVSVPYGNMTDKINQLPDGRLSGTPRVMLVSSGGMGAYLKVYPTYGGSDTEPDPGSYLTYDDGSVYGGRRNVGFIHGGQYFWTGANVILAPASNLTADPVCTDPDVRMPDSSITGSPSVFGFISGGVRYYFKAYAWAGYDSYLGATIIDPGIDFLKIRAAFIGVPLGAFTGESIQEEGGDPIYSEDGLPIETEGGGWCYRYVKSLFQIKSNMIGHIVQTSDYPIFYACWEGKIWLYPPGSSGYSLLLYPSEVVKTAADLPYRLQLPCMSFAMGMAHIKDERFPAASDFLLKSRAEAYFYRESLYGDDQDSRRFYGIE